MRFETLLGVKKYSWFIFRCTNQCNLHCENCNTWDNLPISPKSPFKNRRQKWVIDINELKLFCRRFKGIGDNWQNFHRLTGGEFTMLSVKKMKEVIDVFSSHKRSLCLITNGYNLLGLNPSYLNKIGFIVLDDHGINHNHILDCRKHLNRFYKGEVRQYNRLFHYNCIEAKNHSDNVGMCTGGCRIPQAPSLLRGVIYPCPAFEFIEMIDKNTLITESLIKAGWSLSNPNIVKVLKNWRKTIPDYVNQQCLNNCWHPHIEYGRKARITLKPHDVIKKGG